jgi:TolB-like protein
MICLNSSCVILDGMVNKSTMKASARDGASEVVIMRSKDQQGGRISVYIDGEQKASLSKGNTTKLIIPDGPHTVFLDWEKSKKALNGNTIQFISFKDRTIFRAILGAEELTVQLEGKTVLSSGNTGGIGMAISKTFDVLTANIPGLAGEEAKKTIVSIVNISARDSSQGDYVIDELTNLFVNSKKFEVVDRNNLGAIKNEQAFQLSGDVSDESIVSIGEQLGANVVITGRIVQDGPNNYLRVRALDVKTSRILSMSSESF